MFNSGNIQIKKCTCFFHFFFGCRATQHLSACLSFCLSVCLKFLAMYIIVEEFIDLEELDEGKKIKQKLEGCIKHNKNQNLKLNKTLRKVKHNQTQSKAKYNKNQPERSLGQLSPSLFPLFRRFGCQQRFNWGK